MDSLNKQYLYLALVVSLIALILSSCLATGDLGAKKIKVKESDTKGYLALFDNPSGTQKIKTGGANGLYFENNKLYIGDQDIDGNRTYVGETGLVIETGSGTCVTLGAANGASGVFNLPAGVNGGTLALAGGDDSIAISRLDIDGGTDIGADLVDSDLIIVDDGAAGTNRKCEVSRLKTYIGTGTSTIDGLNDAKAGGANFADSIKIGSSTTGTLNNAYSNTALGIDAMESLTSGYENTLIGYHAGNLMTTANRNTMIGACAGAKIATSNESVGIGYEAFQNSTSVLYGLAVGVQAGANSINSIGATYVGSFAGWNQTGNYNTHLGYRGYFGSFTGSNNTCLGNGASPSASAASNEVVLGNDSVSALRCQITSITALSDKRDKKDIIDNPYGLEFINKIRPVQFTWDKRSGGEINGTKRLGFIAQELQEAMGENDNDILNLVYDSNPDRLEVTQGNLIPILVKAIQDLRKEVNLLKESL